MIELIAFDGDDTLWQNERLYRAGRQRYQTLLGRYGIEQVDEALVDAVELRNLPFYGYGVMSFVLSLIESAIEFTEGRITSADIQELLDLGKQMLGAEVEILEHVVETLETLSPRYPLMLITKGEPTHQLAKLARSGLAPYFRHVEVVHDKTPAIYAGILQRLSLPADRFLMVGNSLRSDILPVIELGGWAAYVPHELIWNHEQAEPPENGHPRLFELESLAALPDLLDRLGGPAAVV